MSQFAGTWQFASSDHLEELLRAIGMNEDFIAKSRDDKPAMTITVSDNNIHLKTEGRAGILEESLTFNVRSERKSPTEKTTMIKESDTRMKAVFTGTANPAHTIYEICGNELHVTSTAGGVTSKAIFVKA
ncbi:unnamed protein product [Calicophoron daubneyi]|uniref:Uncharacterized protein n=1 Tax=Calicophoron daubneyi TaxID=300641 RepID=A0AAV2TT18_CALDB